MPTNQNKDLMERFITFINSADERLANELIAWDATFHVPGSPQPMIGPKGYLNIIYMMRSGFPDIQWSLEETISEGETVAARFVMQGTHQGAFFDVPATGNKIKVTAINIYRFSGNQIIEEYGQPDMLGLMQQIGALPSASA